MFENVKLVICDIDSTLCNDKKVVELPTVQAINDLRKTGVLFGIASGRPIKDIEDDYRAWGLEQQMDLIIGYNGGELWDKQDNSFEQYYPMKKQWLKETIDLMRPFKTIPNIYWKDAILATDYNERLEASAKRSNRRLVLTQNEEDLYQEDCPKIMFRMDVSLMEGVEAYLAEHQNENYVGFRTQPFLIEFCDKRVNKAVGVVRYCQKHHIDLNEVIAIGDTTNDNEMLKCCYGICMKNGTDDTKACAKEITEFDNNNLGVAHFINERILSSK